MTVEGLRKLWTRSSHLLKETIKARGELKRWVPGSEQGTKSRKNWKSRALREKGAEDLSTFSIAECSSFLKEREEQPREAVP